MITPERVCEIYYSLLLHFKKGSTFNASKYNFKTKVKQIKPGQYWLYQRITKVAPTEQAVVIFFVANYIKNGCVFPYISNMSSKHYTDWLEIFESKEQHFKTDIQNLYNKYHNFDLLFKPDENNISPLLKCVIQNSINYNTVIILDKLTNFAQDNIKKINENTNIFVYGEYTKIKKISQLITLNSPAKYKQIILNIFSKNH
jgi:hypothetical protein